MIRKVEIVSCDFCGDDVEGMLATAKVRDYCKGEPIDKEPIDKPVRLYNQIFFNWCGTTYVYDICSKCADKLANGEISISTDMSADRRFTNG